MRLSLLLLVLTMFLALPRGEIYGTVRLGDQFLSGVTVEVTTRANTVSAQTDRFGAYRLSVRETGNCTLRVRYGGQAPSLEIISFTEPTRYRLVLQEAGGTYSLRTE